MKNYSVFIGFSGMESQEEFQGNLDACKGYAYAMKDFQNISTIHIVELSPEHYWADDLEVMLDQELTPQMIEGYDDILVII
jgi:hypothetical protein